MASKMAKMRESAFATKDALILFLPLAISLTCGVQAGMLVRRISVKNKIHSVKFSIFFN